MVLMAIVGSLGIGKTLALTYLAWRNYRKGVKIYANYDLKIPYTPVKTIKDVLNMKEGFFAGDELWNWLDCTHPDTIIVQDDNVSSVKDMYAFASVQSVNFKLDNLIDDVQCIVSSRELGINEPLYEIRTSTNSIKVTGNHRFFVFKNNKIEEVYAKDIKAGDCVLVAKKINSPKKRLIDKNLAEFLGYVHGDGTIYYTGDGTYWKRRKAVIKCDDQDKELLETYGKIMKKQYSLNYNINKSNSANCYRLTIISRDFIRKLAHILQHDPKIEVSKWGLRFNDIPDVVVRSNNTILSAYLRGLFDAEGSVVFKRLNSKMSANGTAIHTRICINMNSGLNFMRLKNLLLRFGIRSTVRRVTYRSKGKKETEGDKLIIHDRESVLLFYKHIGFNSRHKKELLKKCVNYIKKRKINNNKANLLPFGKLLKSVMESLCKDNGVPINTFGSRMLKKYGLSLGLFTIADNISVKRAKNIINVLEKEFGSNRDIDFMKSILYSNIGFDKVKEVNISNEYVPLVYDLSVPLTENYIANGFVVHNSRTSMKKKNQIVGNFLLTSRKRGVNFAFTTQTFGQIDLRIRRVCDFIALPNLTVDEKICRLVIFSNPSLQLVKMYKFKTAPIFELYDTHEVVDALPDEDESMDLIRRKERMKRKREEAKRKRKKEENESEDNGEESD